MEDNFLFFWGHHPSKDGKITKSCLSQWWDSPFIVKGISYKTAEHWMMATKADIFKDDDAFANILNCNSPADVKAKGRLIKNFDATLWDQCKLAVVIEGNYYKFASNPELKSFLLDTDELRLVEASPYDTIWGIGMSEDDPRVTDESQWKGSNLLGTALMIVRNLLSYSY